jgi:hypothetical protein
MLTRDHLRFYVNPMYCPLYSEVYFNIIFSSTPRSPKWLLSFRFSHQFCKHSLVTYMCYMPRSSRLSHELPDMFIFALSTNYEIPRCVRRSFLYLYDPRLTKTKLHGQSPRANYTDRATAACRISDCQLLRIEGATWSA